MTQRDVVLKALRDAGTRGVHTFELRAAYIGNPSQRIAELEAAGYVISHTRERLHGRAMGTRYRLVESVSGETPAGHQSPTPTPAVEPTLFDTGPRNAIFDEAA